MTHLKILMLHPTLAPYRIDLFNSLAAKCNFKLVLFKENLDNQKFDQRSLENQLECQYEYLIRGFKIKNYCFRFGLRKIIKEFSPDIIISSEFNVQTIQLALLKKIGLLKPDIKIITLLDDNKQLANKKKMFKKFCLKMLDGLILSSNIVKDIYSMNYNFAPEKIAICPVVQDTKSIRRKINMGHYHALNFIKKYDLVEKRIILYVGRLTKVKNLEFLLRAFAKNNDDAARLVLVGSGELENDLKLLAKELNLVDRVIFAGRFEEEELYAWYLIGQLLVLPSSSEPFGAVVNEALAAGIPCLVSKAAGVVSLMTKKAQGAIFNPENIVKFTQLLNETIKALPVLESEDPELPPSLLDIELDEMTNDLINHFNCLREKNNG